MNSLLNKHYKLFFILVCIYPIYLDIYNSSHLLQWVQQTTMQSPFYNNLKKHEVIAIALYAINIALIISMIAIASNEHQIFKKLQVEFLNASAVVKTVYAVIFGTVCNLIPLAMDFIKTNQKTSTTHLFLIGFSSIYFSYFLLSKYIRNEFTEERKLRTLGLMSKILIGSFCIYLFVKPMTIEGYEAELRAVMHGTDDAKFYKEALQVLKNAEEDNSRLTEEQFMALEPFRSNAYPNHFGGVLSDFCTPYALGKIYQITNRLYRYQSESAIKHTQQFGKEAVEKDNCELAVNSQIFYNRAIAIEALLQNACSEKLLTMCQK